jgi:hypothetical protein
MAVSAYTPRRAYAIAGIIAVFLIPGIVASTLIGIETSGAGSTGSIGSLLVLLSPATILDGTRSLFFGKELPEELVFFDLPLWTFLASAIVVSALAALAVVRRFVRFAT